MVFDELARMYELFQLPFMQRALIGAVLTGLTAGLMGSFTVVRQMSFFSDALGSSLFLDISLGILLEINPTWIAPPIAAFLVLVVVWSLKQVTLWADTILSIVCSSSLAVSVIFLSLGGSTQNNLSQLLFGDVLAVQSADLIVGALLLAACVLFLGLTMRSQLLLMLNEPLARSRGVSVSTHRTAFVVLLALVVGVSIQAVGVLLISAFVVIPACTACSLGRTFTQYMVFSAGIGGLSAALGIVTSALFDLPSGPSIVTVQFAIFMMSVFLPKVRAVAA